MLVAVILGGPDVPSRRCHFMGVCAGMGLCDDRGGKSCGALSKASCEVSYDCARHGACDWGAIGACVGNDPSRCEPDSVACKSFGQCKVGETNTYYYCSATKKGCRESETCRVDGYCALRYVGDGWSACWSSAKGCRESHSCKRRGKCKFNPRELTCDHDPKACPGSVECQKFGSCSSNGGVCAYEDADCARSELCTFYGGCSYRYQNCDPNDRNCATTSCGPRSDEHCQEARICKEYGACKHNQNRCSRTAETATCKTKAVKIKSISASTTLADLGDLSLAVENLVDDRYDTAWVPDPATPFPHRLRVELPSRMRVAGFRMASGFHRIDRNEGILVEAFGIPLGLAFKADGVVQDAFRLLRDVEWCTHLINPVEAEIVEFEIFDSDHGSRFENYAITELEVLVCE